jgi:hypothetical protein
MRTLLLGGLALALCSTVAAAQNQPSPSQRQPAQTQSMQSQSMRGATTQNAASADQAGQAPAAQQPQNAALKSPSRNNASMPVAGANSFTEGEARSRIQARGYSNVGSLKKDKDGIWRGTATKDGQQVAVSVDYQGNVN